MAYIKGFEFDGYVFKMYSHKHGGVYVQRGIVTPMPIGWFGNVREAIRFCREYGGKCSQLGLLNI